MKTEAYEMEYSNTTRIAQNGLADRFAMLLTTLRQARDRRRVHNQTVRELGGLNDRELADLGIHRAMIPQIAMEAAYGR